MRFTEIEVATSFGEMLIWSPNLCRTLCHNPVLLTDAIGYFSVRLHTCLQAGRQSSKMFTNNSLPLGKCSHFRYLVDEVTQSTDS